MKKTNYLAAPFQQTSYYSGQWMKQSQCGRENKHTTRAKQRAQKKGGHGGAVLRQGNAARWGRRWDSKGEAWWQVPVCRRKPCPLRGHRAVGHCCHFPGWDITSLADPEHNKHLKSCVNSWLAANLTPLFAHKSTGHPQPSGQELRMLPGGKGRSWNLSQEPEEFVESSTRHANAPKEAEGTSRLRAQHATSHSPFQKPFSKKKCQRIATSNALWKKVLPAQSKSWWFRIEYKDLLNIVFLPGSFCTRIIASQHPSDNPKATGTWQHHLTPKPPKLSSPAALEDSLLQRWVSPFDLQALCLEKQAYSFLHCLFPQRAASSPWNWSICPSSFKSSLSAADIVFLLP